MATTMTSAGVGTITSGERAARPSFLGVMRGEWIKLSRQWSFWIMCGLMCAGYLLVSLILVNSGNFANEVAKAPTRTLYIMMEATLFLLRIFWGMMLIVLTARLIGMEYSGGTIRVLLGRGVGRLQLLFGKLALMAVVAVVGAVVFVAFALLCDAVMTLAVVHNLDALKGATSGFWADTRAYAGTLLVSMGVSILLAAAVTTVTRSLAAGMSVSIAWFPVDNLAILILVLGDALTHWDFWSLVSGDFLGLNLNVMASLVMSKAAPAIRSPFIPLTPVTSGHTFLITAIYAAVFLVVAVALTALRDVKE